MTRSTVRRRAVYLGALLPVAPFAVLLGWFLLEDGPDPRGSQPFCDGQPPVMEPPTTGAPTVAGGQPAPADREAEHRVLADLAAMELASGEADAARLAGARELLDSRAAPPGPRYVALRALERGQADDLVARCRALVEGASSDDPGQRFLAANALGVLARQAGARPLLSELSRSAPTEELRSIASTLANRTR